MFLSININRLLVRAFSCFTTVDNTKTAAAVRHWVNCLGYQPASVKKRYLNNRSSLLIFLILKFKTSKRKSRVCGLKSQTILSKLCYIKFIGVSGWLEASSWIDEPVFFVFMFQNDSSYTEEMRIEYRTRLEHENEAFFNLEKQSDFVLW